MDRRVICVRIPAFEIALARLEDPALRTWPVAIASVRKRGILREVSSEAFRDGLSPGIEVDHARWLCPALKILPPSAARVRRGQQGLQEIVSRFAPVWEPVGPGHLFLDVTGTHRLFGAATDTASLVGGEIAQRSGLSAALATGTNKLVTQVATTIVQPAELYDVRPGSERPFMAPLPPAVLPELKRPGARSIRGVLEDLNLCSLGAIADIPLAQLHLVIGSFADELHRRAQGIDYAPVFAARARPWRMEGLTLEPDAVDVDKVLGSVFTLVERLARELRDHQLECRRLRVTAVHTDDVEVSREGEVDPGTCWETDLFRIGERLLNSAVKRRVRIRRVIVEAKVAPLPHEQLTLFGETHSSPLWGEGFGERGKERVGPYRPTLPVERGRRVAEALDRIRHRFGETAVKWGRTTDYT